MRIEGTESDGRVVKFLLKGKQKFSYPTVENCAVSMEGNEGL